MDNFEIKYRHTTVYLWIFQRYDLKPIDGLLISLIYGLSKKDGYCWASRKTLARWLGITMPTLDKSIHRLLGKELISKLGKSPYRTSEIQVTEEAENFFSDAKKAIEEKIQKNIDKKIETLNLSKRIIEKKEPTRGRVYTISSVKN